MYLNKRNMRVFVPGVFQIPDGPGAQFAPDPGGVPNHGRTF